MLKSTTLKSIELHEVYGTWYKTIDPLSIVVAVYVKTDNLHITEN